MKVLFIDDEPLIRQGLQAVIPWKDYGFTEFFEAEDGTEGFELIERENPDLVMLDIHMETMSGLSLAKKVRENDFNGRIIILSGYSDFAYAKTAISCGVTAYLVKPVDPEALTEAVQRAIDELQKEKLLSIYSEQPTQLSKNSILTNILLGNMSYTPEMESVYHIKLDSNYYRLISFYSLSEEQPLNENRIISSLGKNYITVSFSETEIVMIATGAAQEQYVRKLLTAHFEDDDIQDSNFIALFSSQGNSRDTLGTLYAENKKLYADLYYYKTKKCHILSADSVKKRLDTAQLSDINLIEFTENLLHQVLLLQNAEVSKTTLTLLDFLAWKKPPRDNVGFMLINCYTQIVAELISHYPQLEFELADKERFTSRLYADRYLCDSISYLNSQLQKAIAFIEIASQASPCQRICQYIETNFASPLKLETIAALFGYNSAYLGKLFAKEVGEHFNTYLDKIRIQKAREYLEKGATVTQACEFSGFTNTDYFTKKFKKYVGTLPSEYRKQFL